MRQNPRSEVSKRRLLYFTIYFHKKLLKNIKKKLMKKPCTETANNEKADRDS